MTRHWAYLFAVAVLLVAFSVPMAAQQDTLEELRAKAEQGDAGGQLSLGRM